MVKFFVLTSQTMEENLTSIFNWSNSTTAEQISSTTTISTTALATTTKLLTTTAQLLTASTAEFLSTTDDYYSDNVTGTEYNETNATVRAVHRVFIQSAMAQGIAGTFAFMSCLLTGYQVCIVYI